jgi:hypothetical protein
MSGLEPTPPELRVDQFVILTSAINMTWLNQNCVTASGLLSRPIKLEITGSGNLGKKVLRKMRYVRLNNEKKVGVYINIFQVMDNVIHNGSLTKNFVFCGWYSKEMSQLLEIFQIDALSYTAMQISSTDVLLQCITLRQYICEINK